MCGLETGQSGSLGPQTGFGEMCKTAQPAEPVVAALAQQLRFSRGSGRLTIACSWAREAPNCFLFRKTAELRGGRLVGAAGIEPATPGLEIRCSIHLSYAPLAKI